MLSTPFLVDVLQVVTHEKPEFDLVYLLMAVIPSIVSSVVRILYEAQKTIIKTRRVFFIITCSLFLSCGIYALTFVMSFNGWMVFVSLGIGLVATDIVKFMIEQMPSLLTDLKKIALDALKYFANKKVGKEDNTL